MSKSNSLSNDFVRDNTIDVAKCILIILVVWGHAIQYFHGLDYDFWGNPIFKFIYGFHMPLFSLISGYLMYGSFMKYGAQKIILKKANQLLVPTIGWAFILTTIDVILNYLTHDINSFSWTIGRFFSRTLNDLWFLKAMFIACFIVVIIEKFCKGHWFIYILCTLLTLFLPNIYNFAYYGFVFPFFIIGFKFGRLIKHGLDNQSVKMRICIFVSSLIVYFILLVFFTKENYIYISGMNILCYERLFNVQLGLVVYRALTALCGCVMIFEGSSLITTHKKWITILSCKTMIIYIFTASIFLYVYQIMNKLGIRKLFEQIPSVIIDIFLIPVCVFLILLALLVEKIINKIHLGKVLLGK